MDADLTLLDAWRQGDKTAGNQLFDKYFQRMYRFFLHKGAHDSAPDLVQRTFLACVEAPERFEARSSFRAFLFGIARHELLYFWRTRDRERFDPMSSTLEGLAPSAGTLLDMKAEDRELLTALRSLPMDLQVLVELFYWERMPGPELAEVLRVPEGTIRSRLRKARELLAARLAEIQGGEATVESTLSNLDGWAESLKQALDTVR